MNPHKLLCRLRTIVEVQCRQANIATPTPTGVVLSYTHLDFFPSSIFLIPAVPSMFGNDSGIKSNLNLLSSLARYIVSDRGTDEIRSGLTKSHTMMCVKHTIKVYAIVHLKF
jgi:hypothetical protein